MFSCLAENGEDEDKNGDTEMKDENGGETKILKSLEPKT